MKPGVLSSVFGLLHRAPLSGVRKVLAATLGSPRLPPGPGLAFFLYSQFLGLPWEKGLLLSTRLRSQPEELRQSHCEEENGQTGPGLLSQPIPEKTGNDCAEKRGTCLFPGPPAKTRPPSRVGGGGEILQLEGYVPINYANIERTWALLPSLRQAEQRRASEASPLLS